MAEGDNKPYVASGSIYIRRGANSQKLRTPAEMRQLFEEAGAIHFDEAVNKWFRMEDVSSQAIKDFKKKAGITFTAPNPELIKNFSFYRTAVYRRTSPSSTPLFEPPFN